MLLISTLLRRRCSGLALELRLTRCDLYFALKLKGTRTEHATTAADFYRRNGASGSNNSSLDS